MDYHRISTGDWIFGTFMSLMVIALLVVVVDFIFTTSTVKTGFVVDKQYKPASHSTGIGTAIGNGIPMSGGGYPGGTSLVITSHSESEDFLLMVQDSATCEIVTLEVSSQTYYSKDLWDKVSYTTDYGYITGLSHGSHLD